MKEYTCEICSFSSPQKNDYRRHINTKKHRNNSEKNLKTYTEASSKKLILAPKEPKKSQKEPKRAKKEPIKEPVKKFCCNYCDKHFLTFPYRF